MKSILSVLLASSAFAALPDGWKTCGGLDHAYNRTACPSATATCCKQRWAPGEGNWGCIDGADATCCSNGYTACPAGTSCKDNGGGWSVVTTCVPNAPDSASMLGQQVCKQGAPIPLSTTQPNVLILGDSVSIGYTPFVATQLADVALVQHTPWGGDGGAEETKYGFQCLDYLTRAPDGTPLRPDVLYFNFGMHNLHNTSIPGQAGPTAEYAPYLEKIASTLSTWSQATPPAVKLMFGITSPYLNNKDTDNTVLGLNKQAQVIMDKYNIATVDLHQPIIDKCGPVPQAECFGEKGCWSPHCPPGYSWLAETVVSPALKKLLATN